MAATTTWSSCGEFRLTVRSLLVVVAFAALGGTATSILPARRASQLSVLRAIAPA